MDPALSERLRAAEEETGRDRMVEAIIRLARPDAEIPDVRLVARFGAIATCRIPAGAVVAVRAHPDVVSLKAARTLSPGAALPATAAGPVRATDVRRAPGLVPTGAGVVVAAADWGVDVDSAAFRRPSGSRPTRFLALWDQRGDGDGPEPYGYGTVHDRAAIDAALRDPRPYDRLGFHPAIADRGTGTHGTHVLDIAAGNGCGGGPSGLAPEADLVFVHLADRDTGGLANLGDSVRLLEAVDFIARVAGGRPWVINVSVGRCGGPHNGRSLAELAFDALLAEAPGRFIVQSTGNYYRARTHTAGTLRPGETRSFTFVSEPGDATPNELEIWYDGGDAFDVRIDPPGHDGGRPVSLGERAELVVGGRVVGRVYHRTDPNGSNHVDAFLYPAGLSGTWTVTLEGRRVGNGRFDAWLERDDACAHCQPRFARRDSVPTGTTGTIANGRLPLVVGAYDGHDPARPVARFSSVGPTRDGRAKPDCAACGVDVLAGRSAALGTTHNAGLLVRKSGTSMAAPHVTGAVALCLQLAGHRLTARQLRSAVLDSCDPPRRPDPERRLGRGYLNVPRLLATVQRTLAAGTQESIMENEPLGPALPAAPAIAYREYLYRPAGPVARWLGEHYDVVARPGRPPERVPCRGDVLLQVTLGSNESGRCAVLDGPALDRMAARRRMPPGHLLLRPLPDPAAAGEEGADPQLDRLIDEGQPENQITNVLFYTRHPERSGTVLGANDPAARQWRTIRDREVRPALRRRLVLRPIDPIQLGVFLSQYENDPWVPAAYTKLFMTGPPLLSMGRTLRDRVLGNWLAGGRPLTAQGLYELALSIAGEPGTALLLCHNVTKAFVRGGVAITWDSTRTEGEYTDGRRTYTAKVVNPAGRLRFLKRDGKREVVSIFYLLFAADEFGTDDPGDWYHFFVTATMAATAGAGGPGSSAGRGRREDLDAFPEDRGFASVVDAGTYETLLGDRMRALAKEMTRPALAAVPGYRGWVLANTLSFLEGGGYGKDFATDQSDVARESAVHLRGAAFALRMAGGPVGPAWRWHVPKAGSLSKTDLALGFSLAGKTAAVWGPDAKPAAGTEAADGEDNGKPPPHVAQASAMWKLLFGQDPVLSNVQLLDLAQVPSTAVAKAGFDGWTNSKTRVYLAPSAAADLLTLETALRHEAAHVLQFARTGRPTTYTRMMRYEREAYEEMSSWLRKQAADPKKRGPVLTGLQEAADTQLEAFKKEISRVYRGYHRTQDIEQQYRNFLEGSYLPKHGSIDELYDPPKGKLRNPTAQETESDEADDSDDELLAELDGAGSAEFSGPEHKKIGDTGSGKETTTLSYGNPPQPLTFGDVVSMAGDYFESYEQMRDLSATAAGRAELEWARWRCLQLGEAGVAEPRVADDVPKRVRERYLLLADQNLSHFSAGGTGWQAYSYWHGRAIADALEAGRTGDEGVWRRALTKEAFGDHFLTDLFSAGHVRTPRADIENWYRQHLPGSSRFVNYMAEFLFNRLKTRQQLPPLLSWLSCVTQWQMRRRIRELGGEAVRSFSVADIVSLALHDHDNNGLKVVSEADPDGRTVPGGHFWTAVGDGHLGAGAEGAATTAMAVAALIGSLRDLERVRGVGVRQGSAAVTTAQKASEIRAALGPEGFAARAFVPRADPRPGANPALATTDGTRAPLEWRWGQLGPAAYQAVDQAVKGQIATDLLELARDVKEPMRAPLGIRIFGLRSAISDLVNHLHADGIGALEKAVGKPAR